MTLQEAIAVVEALPPEERKQLIMHVVGTLPVERPQKRRSLLSFRGVGEHVRDLDAQAYVNQLREDRDVTP
ncbi:MAG: hypothetical protein IAE80_13095 [Anaerolinea sp.]|nr:hypothetical protein [Anaerolinea sp.]